MTIDVLPGDRAHIRELARTLAHAFHDDPVMNWMLPDDAARSWGLPRMFATLTRHHFLAVGGVGVASASGVIGAAALWDPPGRWKHSGREELRMMPGFLLAMGGRTRRGMQITELMRRTHPDEPHWYLAVIGSHPTVRGGGFGQALMRSGLDRSDVEHAPAYLESSNPDNVPYYERFGFRVTGEIVLPDGGPSMWPMWRDPR